MLKRYKATLDAKSTQERGRPVFIVSDESRSLYEAELHESRNFNLSKHKISLLAFTIFSAGAVLTISTHWWWLALVSFIPVFWMRKHFRKIFRWTLTLKDIENGHVIAETQEQMEFILRHYETISLRGQEYAASQPPPPGLMYSVGRNGKMLFALTAIPEKDKSQGPWFYNYRDEFGQKIAQMELLSDSQLAFHFYLHTKISEELFLTMMAWTLYKLPRFPVYKSK